MSSSSQAPESWISAFCSLVGHEYFAEVSEDFIEDDFNLTGLQSQVPMYKEALEMILDVEPEDLSEEEEEEEDEDEDDFGDGIMNAGAGADGRGYRREERRHLRMASDLSVIESSAEMLYGLIHQRFITSRAGIQQMAEKYDMGHFGHCPRTFCDGAKVVPVGCSDIPGIDTVKLFCPSCLDVYVPPNSRFQTVDGAFFGTTFGCLFFMTFPELDIRGSIPRPRTESASLNRGASPLGTSASKQSLSSSLSSQHPPIPPPPPHLTTGLDQVNAMPVPAQPDSINGVATRNLAPGLGRGNIYEPRIYGFRVSELAKTGPRMQWLRSRPADINQLDEAVIWERRSRALQNLAAFNAKQKAKVEGEEGAAVVGDTVMGEGSQRFSNEAGEEQEEDEEEEEEEEEEETQNQHTTFSTDPPGLVNGIAEGGASSSQGMQPMSVREEG